MQVSNALSLIALALTLTACGGSSGSNTVGDGTSSTAQTNSSDSDDAQSSSSSSSVPSDGKDPTATILFPTKTSSTDQDKITIRGVASDASGISTVHVNGHKATLLSSTSNDIPTEEAWQITLPLKGGDNTFTVDATDRSGDTTTSADQVFVSANTLQIPTNFSFNPDTQTLYGFAPHDIVDFDLNSKQQRVHVERDHLPISGCFHTGSSSYYYLNPANSDHFELYRVAINDESTAEPVMEGYFPIDQDYASFTTKLVCDSHQDALYFLVNHSLSLQGIDHSKIYRRVLGTNSDWNLLYETEGNSPVITDMVTGPESIIAYSRAQKRIVAISKEGGSSTTLFDNYFSFVINIAYGSTENDVYLTTFDGIDHVNIPEQSISTIGEVTSDDPLDFSQPSSTHLDPINHRFLIGDSDYDSIIAIDQNTGNRSVVLSSDMGSDSRIIAIRDIILNQKETYAYIMDDGGNASEKVFEIDMTTGDKRLIGDINSQANIRGGSLELDESNEVLYAATEDSVYRIDFTTNATTTLALADINQGEVFSSISAIALDKESGQLFISDAQQEKIVALNVNTMETTLVAGEFRGEGQVFSDINGLVFDPKTNTLYASNQGHGNVHKVDPETGDRTELATTCAPSLIAGEPDMIMDLSFDSALNELLLLGHRVTRINVTDSTCDYDNYGFLLSIEPLPESRLLAGAGGELRLIDEETGETVVISQ